MMTRAPRRLSRSPHLLEARPGTCREPRQRGEQQLCGPRVLRHFLCLWVRLLPIGRKPPLGALVGKGLLSEKALAVTTSSR